jgi:hypothetical protein
MLVIFFSYKNREQDCRTDLVWWVGTSRGEGGCGEMFRRVNMVQIQCTHVRKWKKDLSKLFQKCKDKGE